VRILHPNNAKFLDDCPDSVIFKIAADERVRKAVGSIVK